VFIVVVLDKLIRPSPRIVKAVGVLRWRCGIVSGGAHNCFCKGVAAYRSVRKVCSRAEPVDTNRDLRRFRSLQSARTQAQAPVNLQRRDTLNQQIKRRTRVTGLFPNSGSILRFVTALRMEISGEWENGSLAELISALKINSPIMRKNDQVCSA
jgi:hypothetical protein